MEIMCLTFAEISVTEYSKIHISEHYIIYGFKIHQLSHCDTMKFKDIPTGKMKIEIDLIKPHLLIKNHEIAKSYFGDDNYVEKLKSTIKSLGNVDYVMITREN